MAKAMRSKQQIAGIAYRDQGQDICVTSFRYLHGDAVTLLLYTPCRMYLTCQVS